MGHSGAYFVASATEVAQAALTRLIAAYGQAPLAEARVVVPLGGDGFMLQTLGAREFEALPVYGMNCGTIGFLMNEFSEAGLVERIAAAEEAELHPLSMRAGDMDGNIHEALAINEVSLLRMGPQAAKLQITVDGKVRLDELVCDGAMLATPAGSTAYNYSAHGPILPIGAEVLALTAVAAFRPRRWRGALLPSRARVRFDVLQAEKRPVLASADSTPVERVLWVEIQSEPGIKHRILFDPGHGLEERLLSEQFV